MALTTEDCSYIRHRHRHGGTVAALRMIRCWTGCGLCQARTILDDCVQRRPWTTGRANAQISGGTPSAESDCCAKNRKETEV